MTILIEHRIRKLRKERGISQEELASILGVSQQAISRIETYQYDIPSDLLIKMSHFFNVTSDYILGISEFKRTEYMQQNMIRELEAHYTFIKKYEGLSPESQKVVDSLIKQLENRK